MRLFRIAATFVVLGLACISGCGEKHEHGHPHDHEHAAGEPDGHARGQELESAGGATFKDGRGVLLSEETRRNIGVETAEVAQRPLPLEIRFNAQVFGETHTTTAEATEHAECTAKASGLLAQTQAKFLHAGQPVALERKAADALGGVVLRVNEALAIGDAEVVVGITNAGAKLKPGEFVFATVTIPRERPVSVVPASAVLRAADGTFVYTVKGGAYLRTAVKTDAESGGLVEITEGLLPAEVVVSKPVEKLWLIELRLTRGGGHGHGH